MFGPEGWWKVCCKFKKFEVGDIKQNDAMIKRLWYTDLSRPWGPNIGPIWTGLGVPVPRVCFAFKKPSRLILWAMGTLIELWIRLIHVHFSWQVRNHQQQNFNFIHIWLNTKSDNSGQVHQLVETIGNIGKLIFLDNFRRNRKRIKGGVQLLKVWKRSVIYIYMNAILMLHTLKTNKKNTINIYFDSSF